MSDEKDKEIARLKALLSDYPKGHDPIKDEFKKYSIVEFQFELMDQLVEFTRQIDETGKNPVNEEQKITHHTFTEWMSFFRQWASW